MPVIPVVSIPVIPRESLKQKNIGKKSVVCIIDEVIVVDFAVTG
jgi:hypothetical protein